MNLGSQYYDHLVVKYARKNAQVEKKTTTANSCNKSVETSLEQAVNNL